MKCRTVLGLALSGLFPYGGQQRVRFQARTLAISPESISSGAISRKHWLSNSGTQNNWKTTWLQDSKCYSLTVTRWEKDSPVRQLRRGRKLESNPVRSLNSAWEGDRPQTLWWEARPSLSGAQKHLGLKGLLAFMLEPQIQHRGLIVFLIHQHEQDTSQPGVNRGTSERRA